MTDEMLQQAAANSVECFMKSVMRDYDPKCPVTLSPQFEKRISKLTRRANHPHVYRAMHRVAAALVAIALSGIAWLTVDSEARAVFTAWVREVYENNIIYEFFGQRDSGVLPEYAFAVTPEGFVETDFIAGRDMCVRVYDNNGEALLLSYMVMSDKSTTSIFSNGYCYESVQVGAFTGDYYEAEDPSESNELIWFDEEHQVVFQISAFLTKDKMLTLAEGIIKK